MRLEVTVCGVCRDPARPTDEYEIKRSAGTITEDLCELCAEPIEHVLETIGPRAPVARGARSTTSVPRRQSAKAPVKRESAKAKATRSGGTPIMTLEEIDAAKKASARS